MLKTGHHLSNDEIRARYEDLTHRGDLGPEFLRRVVALAGSLEGLRILDLGCGTGGLLTEIAARQDNCELYGVDFSLTSLQEAANRLAANAILLEADIQALPFPGTFFDRIFCTETLEHLKHPASCFYEIIRVLKDDGLAIVTIPNATGFAPFHLLGPLIPGRWLKSRLLPYEHPSNTDQPIDTLYGYDEIVNLIRTGGLRIDTVDGYRYFRYLQMLPVVRNMYRLMYPLVERLLPKIKGVRFAYNLLLRCSKASISESTP
jgi:ubiquinone/menaquinone biosynthesis C-methylase UbiE